MAGEEKKIILNHISINYSELGNGNPLIFLHNGGGFWQSWYYQIKYFSQKYKVYAIDWPGFGGSGLPNGLLSLDLLVEILSSFMLNLNIPKACFIGNCIGASATLKFAILFPDKVDKLILLNICPGDKVIPGWIFRKLIRKLNQTGVLKSLFENILKFIFLKTWVKNKFPGILFGESYYPDDALALEYIEKFKQPDQTESRVNLLFSVFTYNLDTILKGHVPPEHMMIWGRENKVVPLISFGWNSARILKSKQFEIVENAGHLCAYESPGIVNSLIENYLENKPVHNDLISN
ncbi:MAG: alpha/beta hydrolase [Bacteroidales bacterium]